MPSTAKATARTAAPLHVDRQAITWATAVRGTSVDTSPFSHDPVVLLDRPPLRQAGRGGSGPNRPSPGVASTREGG